MCITYRNGSKETHLFKEDAPSSSPLDVGLVYQQVEVLEGLPRENFYLTFNGRCLDAETVITSPCCVRLHVRLPGGKGGFGSMLRAIGARIEKTTNREACRDLSGRRMRDVNYEKEMGEWLKQKEKEAEDKEEREKNKLQKLDRIINPKHNYEDNGYTSNLQANADKIDDALKVALQKRDKNLKRKLNGGDGEGEGEGRGKEKKGCGWMGIEMDEDDQEEEEGEVYSDLEGEDIVSSVSKDGPGCSKSMTQVGEASSDCVSKEKNNEFYAGSGCRSSEEPTSSGSEGDECPKSSCETPSGDHTKGTAETVTDNSNSDTSNNENSDKTVDRTSSTNSSETVETVRETPSLTRPLESLNLEDFSSAEELESVGLEVLKFSLTELGLKCGGTLQERAQRLFSTKGLTRDQIDPALFAKPSKGKNKKQKK